MSYYSQIHLQKQKKGRFKPPCKLEELQQLLDSARNGVICVPSRESKLVYMLKGVESLTELVDVLTWLMRKDYQSGVITFNAERGYFVYLHSDYERVKRKLHGV